MTDHAQEKREKAAALASGLVEQVDGPTLLLAWIELGKHLAGLVQPEVSFPSADFGYNEDDPGASTLDCPHCFATFNIGSFEMMDWNYRLVDSDSVNTDTEPFEVWFENGEVEGGEYWQIAPRCPKCGLPFSMPSDVVVEWE